jgi:hypothetical protein
MRTSGGLFTLNKSVWTCRQCGQNFRTIPFLLFYVLMASSNDAISNSEYIDHTAGWIKCWKELIWITILEFIWRDWGKPRETSVRVACLPSGIWTQDLPNTKQKSCPLDCDVRRGTFHISPCAHLVQFHAERRSNYLWLEYIFSWTEYVQTWIFISLVITFSFLNVLNLTNLET